MQRAVLFERKASLARAETKPILISDDQSLK